MKILLIEDVAKIGKAGDLVEVKAGYGRNFLIKQNKGILGTSENLEAAEKEEAVYRQNIERLEDEPVKMTAKASPKGKLFGSIVEKDVALAISKQFDLQLPKKAVHLKAPIKTVGLSEGTLSLKNGETIYFEVEIKGV